MTKYRFTTMLFVVTLVLTGCQTGGGEATTQPPMPSVAESTSTVTETPIQPESLIFINRLQAWPRVSDQLQRSLEAMAESKAWISYYYDGIPERGQIENPALLVILGGEADISPFIEDFSDTPIILVAVVGAVPGEHVAVIGPEGMRADKVAFLSGYISAMVTPDWRVGVIGVNDTGEGLAARKSFINGAVFFCGLCRPAYPPFIVYPTSISIGTPDEAGISYGFGALSEKTVTTIGLTHEIPGNVVDYAIQQLTSSAPYWIGPHSPSDPTNRQWLATVLPNPGRDIEIIYDQLVLGHTDVSQPMPIEIAEVNEGLITEGKLQLIRSVVLDLERGIIDTGVDPISGEDR